MSAENRQETLQTALYSLTNEETLMADEVYKMAEKLDSTVSSSAALNPECMEDLRRLDSCVEDTLSGIIQKEFAAFGNIENVLSQYQSQINLKNE